MATEFGFSFGIWFLSLVMHEDHIFMVSPATGRIRNLLFKKKKSEKVM